MSNRIVRDKISKAKMRIISRDSFFGFTLINTRLVSDNSIQTMATDGVSILYNDNFILEKEVEHIAFAFEHELYHKILLHPKRYSEDKIESIWQIACDLAVHSCMVNAGKYVRIITSNEYYYDPMMNGKTADEIYWILASDSKKLEEIKKKGSSFDDHKKRPVSVKEQIDVESSIRSAFKISDGCSKTKHSEIKLEFVKISENKESLKDVLRKYFENSFAKHDYDWMIPDRRFSGSGFCIPSLVNINSKNSIKRCVTAIDISLSVSKAEQAAFLYYTTELAKEFCDELHLFFCDDEIKGHRIITDGIVDLNIPKGYGTDYNPVFDRVDELKINPGLMIYFTDLCVSEGDMPSFTPEYNVLWVKSNHPFSFYTPGFGEVFTFNI